MTTVRKFVNFEEEDIVHERELISVVCPESEIEIDFLLDWIRKELKEDLAPSAEDDELLMTFYLTCDRLSYHSNGMFVFGLGSRDLTAKDIQLYVHPFHFVHQQLEDQEPYEFELIWEHEGVAHSLFDASVIEDLMRRFK